MISTKIATETRSGRTTAAGGVPEPVTTRETTMKAVVQDVYGSADVLKLVDIDKPHIGDGEVLLRVHAAGVDRGVWHLMTGVPYAIRAAGFGLLKPKNRVRGMDVAGRVESIGKDVTRFRPGDDVMGTCNGSFAEYACAREEMLALKPAHLSFAQAAAIPISASAALQAVRDQGQIQAGQKVLVIGASGGVGTFAVQLAKAFGAEVTGVCSSAKVDLVRSIGADHVIDYTRKDFAGGGQLYDLILDIGGNRPLTQLRRALTRRGTLVLVGGEGGGRLIGGTVARGLRALAISPFVRQRLRMFISKAHSEALQSLTELIEAGKITPVVDRAYPLSQVPEAIRYLEKGHARGKVVITV